MLPDGRILRWNRAPKEMVDRVEVLRGGGSSLYGTYAMGGVIQMFSREPASSGLELKAGFGSRDATDIRAFGSHVAGPWSF